MTLNRFDNSQLPALQHHYDSGGVIVTYNGNLRVVLITMQRTGRREVDSETGVLEVLEIMIRRDAATGITSYSETDVLTLVEQGITKTFTLADVPHDFYSQLEFELTFHRKRQQALGSRQVYPLGGMF